MRFLSVDFQKDFSSQGGRWYKSRPSHSFIKEIFIPTLRSSDIKIAEIISDYRLPRPSETEAYCVPGTEGYESEIPSDVKGKNVWIKCMNSPIWVRESAGIPDEEPGQPYSDPAAFTSWLNSEIGSPEEAGDVVLVGLTLDCCVLCTAQELYFRGYRAKFLVEGVDTYTGIQQEKRNMFETPLPMWGNPITWSEVEEKIFKN